ncbi:MAG: hypothetical protein NC318_10945 [Blautia sp.]|nr:hypothetical protein [Blautia sp.]
MEQLTNQEKFELMEIDIEKIRQKVQEEISMDELYVLTDNELDSIQEIVGDSIELDVDSEESVENTRASFDIKNGQVLVIKAKKINAKLLFSLFKSVEGLISGSNLTRMFIVINLLMEYFCEVLDKDLSRVYTYLANEYFNNGRKFNNIEIIGVVNQYIKESMHVEWSDQKIQEKLNKLEYDLRVIECIDGVYVVTDKINFA